MPEETINTRPQEDPILSAYKKTALLVSSYAMLIFVLRYIAVVVITLVSSAMENARVDTTVNYITQLSLSGMFLQILPSVIGAFMFGYIGKEGRSIKRLYTIPKSNTRAIGNFTAVYGFAHIFNLITIVVMYIFTNIFDLSKQLNTVADETSYGMGGAWMTAFLLVVIAPIFEEFMFRGLILHELKPYGNGLSIFVSGILFGIFHGNFQQCFYTAAFGIALGYIANVTRSIFPTTIIHMITNGLGAITVLLMNTDSVQRFILRGDQAEIPDSDMIWVAIYGIFMVSLLILIFVGFITAIMKIRQIKRYKTPKVWGEVKNSKKVGMLVCTVPAIITILMIIDTYGGFSTALLTSLIQGKAQ